MKFQYGVGTPLDDEPAGPYGPFDNRQKAEETRNEMIKAGFSPEKVWIVVRSVSDWRELH